MARHLCSLHSLKVGLFVGSLAVCSTLVFFFFLVNFFTKIKKKEIWIKSNGLRLVARTRASLEIFPPPSVLVFFVEY